MRGAATLDTFVREAQAAGIRVSTLWRNGLWQHGEVAAKRGRLYWRRPVPSRVETAHELVCRFDLPVGKAVLVVGDRHTAGRSYNAGCRDALRALGVELAGVSARRQPNRPSPMQIKRDLDEQGDRLAAIICLNANVGSVVDAVQGDGLGVDPHRHMLFGISPDIERYLREHKLALTNDSQWAVQGFVAVTQAALCVNHGFDGLDCKLPVRFLDTDTLDQYRPSTLKEVS